MNWLDDYALILGSQSPRRKQLLEDGGFKFTQRLVDVDEIYPESMHYKEVAEFLSKLKSKAYSIKEQELLITADSIVVVNNNILGKPKDKAQGISYLSQISGVTHEVYTGVTLRSLKKSSSFTAITEVDMQSLSLAEIEYYLEHYKPYDKAGGYGIQDWMGICKVRSIKGSYTNVMGLPMARLYDEMLRFLSTE